MENNEKGNLISEVRKIDYRILCDVDKFCKERGIVYFLSGGSCLGAVRHHGFIPWDDDIDIMLPRQDYERFLLEFPGAFEEKYRVASMKTDKKWIHPWGVIWDVNTKLSSTYSKMETIGVGIDVFPIDGLPSNAFARFFYYRKIQLIWGLCKASLHKEGVKFTKYGILKKFIASLIKMFHLNVRYLGEVIESYAKKNDWFASKYVAVSLAMHYWDKETIEKKHMDHQVYVKFEDRLFPIPNGYDVYLKNLYGDYMKIPKNLSDKDKGHTHLDLYNIEIKNIREEK